MVAVAPKSELAPSKAKLAWSKPALTKLSISHAEVLSITDSPNPGAELKRVFDHRKAMRSR